MRDGKQKCGGHKEDAVTCVHGGIRTKCPPKTAMLKLQKSLNKSGAVTCIFSYYTKSLTKTEQIFSAC